MAVPRNTSQTLAANLPPALHSIGHTLTRPKGGWVFRKGEPVEAVYVVLDGEVYLSRFASFVSRNS